MSMESQFMARAGMLAGPGGLAPSSPAARYVLPQFEERTAYGFKRQDPYTKLFEDRIIFLGVQVDDASADDVMAQLLVLESTTRTATSSCTSTRPAARSRRSRRSTTRCSTSSRTSRRSASGRPPRRRR